MGQPLKSSEETSPASLGKLFLSIRPPRRPAVSKRFRTISSRAKKVIPNSNAILPYVLAPSSKMAWIFTPLHRTDALISVGHAGVVSDFSALGDDIVQRKSRGIEHVFCDHMERVVSLAAERNLQRESALANISEGRQTGFPSDGEDHLI